jgi:hypothetical protein
VWQYLQEADAAMAIYLLTEGAWGPKSLQEAMKLCDNTIVLAHLVEGEFAALAGISPIAPKACWLMVWLAPKLRKKYGVYAIWNSLEKLLIKDLGYGPILAVTQEKRIARYAKRWGGVEGDVIKHLYGENKHGYFIKWEKKD